MALFAWVELLLWSDRLVAGRLGRSRLSYYLIIRLNILSGPGS